LLSYYWKKISRIAGFICETPIPKAKRIGMGKLNNPAKRRVQYPAACCEIFPKLVLGFMPVILVTFLTLSITAQAEEKNAEIAKPPMRVAVISFQPLITGEGQGNTVICPLCGIGYSSGKILKGSEKIVEEVFVDKLHELKEVELISTDKVQSVYKRIASESLKEPLLNIFKKVGRELGADVLAVGYVYRYTERVGYEYSSEHPASVSFEIHLIKTIDGSIIWRGFFDKTQKSLMEDVFQISSFVRGGGKWMTARQLTEQGMIKIFKTFPGLEH
jgi:hypothetical protein